MCTAKFASFVGMCGFSAEYYVVVLLFVIELFIAKVREQGSNKVRADCHTDLVRIGPGTGTLSSSFSTPAFPSCLWWVASLYYFANGSWPGSGLAMKFLGWVPELIIGFWNLFRGHERTTVI